MPTHHDGAQPAPAVSSIAIVFAIAAACQAVAAQTAHPFSTPTPVPCLSLGAAAGLADVNRDGSLDVVVPGIFFGTLVATLDEDGNGLSANGHGPGLTPVTGAPTSPVALAMAGGRLDQDAREDLVTVTSAGTLHFHRNLGSTRLDRGWFAPDVLVDNFLAAFPISPPLVNYSFPTVRIVDFDRDGHADVLLAGGPVDRWGGSTRPGFVGFYRGDGLGGFVVQRLPLAGSAIDLEIADLDHDGTHDHVVVLMETGALSAFSYDLLHFHCANGALVASGPAQNLGPGRVAALALADVVGDANLDYLVARTLANGGTTTAQVDYLQGNGQGQLVSGAWGTFLLPPNPTALGEHIPSLLVDDFDRDGHDDLVVVRGFVQAPASYAATATFADSELLVAMGPNLAYATCASIALPGCHVWSNTASSTFAMLPLCPAPDFVRTLDLRRDGTPDLLVTGLRSTTGPQTVRIATLVNTTPAAAGAPGFTKIGAPSGGLANRPARLGFDGGPPQPGNVDFACTLLNVQGGCLVGLVWGANGAADLLSVHGFALHLLPTEFACGVLAAGAAVDDGFSSLPLPIPPLPALVGDAGCFQYVYYDHVTGTFGGTQATALRIGL